MLRTKFICFEIIQKITKNIAERKMFADIQFHVYNLPYLCIQDAINLCSESVIQDKMVKYEYILLIVIFYGSNHRI